MPLMRQVQPNYVVIKSGEQSREILELWRLYFRLEREHKVVLKALYSLFTSFYYHLPRAHTPPPKKIKRNNLMTCNWEEGRSFLIIPRVWECAWSHQRQNTFPAPTKRQSFVFFFLPARFYVRKI